ncbi:MAG: DUF1553 domain-containing protein [Planctomycetia bacterium]|nr:DUF1553 domain-containing protein [Planctomycetia bacterium]
MSTIGFGRCSIEIISMDLRHTFSQLSSTLRSAAVLGAALGCASSGLAEPSDDSFSPEQIAFFESKIRPIFVEHCWKCHAADEKGSLRLDSRDTALAGGDSGPAIVPGKPDESLMVTAVRYTDPSYHMPPSGKLPAAAIKAIEEWVAMGSPYPGATKSAGAGAVRRGEFTVSDEDREHWAYKSVKRPAVPAISEASPIDAFLDEKLAVRKITGNPQATPRELVRRAWFDLVGLPPPIEEVEAFERNPSDEAWRSLIDRLFAMPAYGERWGRHWLDVVRFAQTNGYERDGEKPFAWRYRDWVIAAFNDDMPYDQFVREQVAGDLLEPRTDSGLIASGFWHLGTWDDEPDDGRLARYDELDDMISTVGQGFLGTTINCARCHDHKFDPLGQKDYYSLLGMVHSIRRYSPKYGTEKRKKKDTPDEEEVVEVKPDAFAKLSQEGDWALCAIDGKQPPKTHVFIRGNPGMPGAEVTPGIPEVLKGVVPDAHLADLAGRRALAAWIASPANPLTARVMVNRIWLHHFGRALVPTPNDFGFAGEPPTHEQLLDWLAAEFMEHGWSMKHLHRTIMTSEAYRRSSRADREECIAVDEGNELVWRQNRRRLEAEAIRDSFLAAAGALNPEPGGRGFFTTLGGDCLAGQSKPGKGWEISPAEQQCRRSVYGFVKRTLLLPELESFDYTNTTSSVGERSVTTVSPQALLLTNGAFARRQADVMAKRIAGEVERAGDDSAADERFVVRAYERALARRPTAAEREIAGAYLRRQRSAWAATADTVSLVPLVPSALVGEYRSRLSAEQILAVAPAGWQVGGGVWGGGYEGGQNLDPLTGPFALWRPSGDSEPAAGFEAQGRFAEGAVEVELFVRGATELAAVVIRGLVKGEKLTERFTGYELAIVPPLKAIELRKATAKGSQVLASAKRELTPDAWVHVRLETVGGRITATLDRESTPILTAEDPEPLDRPGHVGLRTWGASLDARQVVARPVGGDPVRIDPAQPPTPAEAAARAERDLCLLILNLNEMLYVD